MVTVLRAASDLRHSYPHACPLNLRRALLKMLLRQTGVIHRNHLVEHSELVGMSAYSLALRITGSQADADKIRLAGLFHDIGKFYVPERLLAKIGPLAASEISLLSTHASESAEIVAALTGDMELADIVRAHHVRFDSMPSGDPLPIQWQILPVADAWETMICGREYRKPIPIEKAIAELRAKRGTQFSPVAVDAWTEIQANNALAA
jgi:putative nucleotidyltransferase with HDIG domain